MAEVTLAAALVLRDVFGMEQGETHHRWYWWERDNPLTAALAEQQPPELSCPGSFGGGVWYDGTGPHACQIGVSWAAAPDELTALMFLEQERGWRWFRSPYFFEGPWAACPAGMLDKVEMLHADSASALIEAIAAHEGRQG